MLYFGSFHVTDFDLWSFCLWVAVCESIHTSVMYILGIGYGLIHAGQKESTSGIFKLSP